MKKKKLYLIRQAAMTFLITGKILSEKLVEAPSNVFRQYSIDNLCSPYFYAAMFQVAQFNFSMLNV